MDDTHTFREGDSSPGFSQSCKSNPPESSCVSMKSEASIGVLITFKGKHTSTGLRMHLILLLLLLLCFISYSGSSSKPVSGIKGGNISLSCGSEDREIVEISLYSRSKHIPVCEKKNCSGRVFKEGSCDVIITDLIYSDAGKYFFHVYYTNNQTEVERLILEYHLHIHDEISVKKGEDLKLDVLFINADKVERNSSSGWTELWTRGHGVNSDRLTVSDETLIIHEFTDTDTGTYRVLDSNNQTWITVTVTESILDSKGNLSDTDEDKTDNTEHRNYWNLLVGLTVVLDLVVLTAVMLHRRRHRDYLRGEITDFWDSEVLRSIAMFPQALSGLYRASSGQTDMVSVPSNPSVQSGSTGA